MKRYIYLFLCFTIGFCLTSCKDMLKEETYGRQAPRDLLSNPENVYKEVGQVYADLKYMQDHWNMFGAYTASSDEALLPVRNPGGDWNDGGYWSSYNTMSWGADAEGLEYIWRTLQEGALICNNVLKDLQENVDVIDPDVYAQATSELIIVRAYYYYMFMDCFGTIPYARSFYDNVTSKPLSTTTETWVGLVEDLLNNVNAIPVISADNRLKYYGRASQGLAYGLLSRLMLNAESFGVDFSDAAVQALGVSSASDAYAKCIEYCDYIINANSYQLTSSYFENFSVSNEGSTENIFVIVNSASNIFDFYETAGRDINKNRLSFLTLFMAFEDAWGINEAWNGLCARESFLQKFAFEDVRGVCNADPTQGPAGTNINFDDEANKRGWFAGPIYAPDDFKIILDKDGNPTNIQPTDYGNIIIQTDKRLPGYDWVGAGDRIHSSGNSQAGKQIPGEDYSYDWSTGQDTCCFAVITVDVPQDPELTNIVATNQVAGARCLKYEVQRDVKGVSGSYYMENDFVLMRYAEILFNKAEAALRIKDMESFSEVLPSLQQIQARAGVSESSQAIGGSSAATYSLSTPEGILDERGREFYWEFLRRRDLIRYDRFSQGTWQFKETVSDKKYDWFPIPKQYIENSGGKWSQREGY